MMKLPNICKQAAALLAITVTLTSPLVTHAQQPFDIFMKDGLITVRANNAPVAELAAALSAETGVRVVITGEPSTAMSTEIIDEPLDKAFAKLSPNHMLVRENSSVDSPIVEVVLIMEDSEGVATPAVGEFLPSGAPADEILAESPPGAAPPTEAPSAETSEALRDSMRRLVARQGAGGELQPPINGTADPLQNPPQAGVIEPVAQPMLEQPDSSQITAQ
ncbi:MAG: hypothetical protein V3U76_14190 [Granulosicoccus sp.]